MSTKYTAERVIETRNGEVKSDEVLLTENVDMVSSDKYRIPLYSKSFSFHTSNLPDVLEALKKIEI